MNRRSNFFLTWKLMLQHALQFHATRTPRTPFLPPCTTYDTISTPSDLNTPSHSGNPFSLWRLQEQSCISLTRWQCAIDEAQYFLHCVASMTLSSDWLNLSAQSYYGISESFYFCCRLPSRRKWWRIYSCRWQLSGSSWGRMSIVVWPRCWWRMNRIEW